MDLIDQAIMRHRAGETAEAEALYRQVLDLNSRDFDALHLLGVLAAQQMRYREAEQLMRAALAVEPDEPSCLSHFGNVLAEMGRYHEALEYYDQALAAAPDDGMLLADRGAARHAMGQFSAAREDFAAAMACDGGQSDAHLHLGVSRLLQGDFAGGWEAFGDRRWDAEERQAREERQIAAPLWRGDTPLADKTILLQGRHGFGDTLQFCRYVPRVAAQGARVILEVPASMTGLLAGLAGVSAVIAAGETRPPFDLHCSLLSLPFAFKTMADTIPAEVPYLRPPADLVLSWARRLGPKRRPRIGIAWSSPSREGRHDPRTVPLPKVLSLRNLGVDLVVLQRDVAASDAAILAGMADIAHPTGDFLDMAAVTSLMDAVASIDSAIAHLAGALGRPTFILLPHVPCWRWLLHRGDSPWYPTVRLFRQAGAGQWDDAIAQVGRAIAQAVEGISDQDAPSVTRIF